MASILFAQTYFYRFDEKQWRTAQPYPPYGTMYAAAYLRELGHQVSIFDTGLRESPDEIESAIKEFKPTYFVLYDDGFNYLSKMCLTRMREAAYTMARLAHESGCKVIISSSDSTDHFTEYLAQKIDYVILGEAEITLAELVNQLESGVDELTKIDGIAAKNSSKEVFRTNSRPVLQNLDSLPDPAWDLIDLEPYRAIWMQNHGYFALNLATTRAALTNATGVPSRFTETATIPEVRKE
ncbi:MAG: cobalamin B12-binding domain-containing protein [Saprospiraceae bacterium]